MGDWGPDLLGFSGISFGLGIALALAIYLVPREWLPISVKLMLGAVTEIAFVYGVSVIVFRGMTTMRLPFWPSVIIGGVIGGLLAALVTGAVWKHVDSLARAEAQSPKSEPPKPPVATTPPAPRPTQSGPTMNAPGGMNFKDSTVINPTIINNPPGSDEVSRKLEKIIKSLDDRANQDRLKAKYPGGYVIFGSDQKNAILPNARNHFSDLAIDWSTGGVKEVTVDTVMITMPDFRPKPGGGGLPIYSYGNTVGIQKRVGATSTFTRITDETGSGTSLVVEILSIDEAGIVFVIGLRPA